VPKVSQTGARLQAAITVGAWLLALGLLAETLVLARQNERLKMAPPPPSLGSLFVAPGEVVGELAGVGRQGRYERVALPGVGSSMVVATLSPGCLSCTDEGPQLKLLLGSAPGYGWRALVVSHGRPQDTAAFVKTQLLRGTDWIADPSYVTYNDLGLTAVPQIILLGPGGVVQKAWHGAVTDTRAQEIATFMAAHRPAAARAVRPVGRGGN